MSKKLIVLQEEIADCGVCSLLSIIRFYKGDVPLEELRIKSKTTKYGVTAYNLIECAKFYGLNGIGKKVSNLKDIKTPCIAHLNINNTLSHFVVIYKVDNEELLIMDPAKGLSKISINEFNKSFTNIVLYFYPRTKLPIIKKNKLTRKLINKCISKEKKSIIAIFSLNLSYILLFLISSTYIEFITKKKILLILFMLNIITLYIKYKLEIKTQQLLDSTDESITDNFLNYILKLPLSYIQFKDKNELIKRIEDLEVIKELSINQIIKVILNAMILIPLFIIISSIYNKFVFSIVIFIYLYTIINFKLNKSIRSYINDEIDTSTEYNNILINTITGLNSVYHSNSNNYFINKLNELKKNKRASSFKLNKLLSKYNFINSSLIKILEIIFNIILFMKATNNELTISEVFILNILFNLFLNSLLELLSTIPINSYKSSLINRIDEILNLKFDTKEENTFTNGDISIENLSFSYDNLNNTLMNFNTKIKKGDKTLIKSTTGSGKTTLFKLINKELNDYKGSIKIDNKEISTIKDLNNYISYISQEEQIFTGTIKENITLGLDVSGKYLKKIINLCELNTVLDKKQFGLDTFLYGGGEELSGGEKQLIILARFLIRNKSILIIDEATSEISQELEDKVLNNILRYYKDKTILFVSHKNKDYLFKNIIKIK